MSKYGPKDQKAALLRDLAVIIIDEVSMLGRALFKFVNKILKYLCGNELRFGGITIIISGILSTAAGSFKIRAYRCL